jgi:hypothetical protein
MSRTILAAMAAATTLAFTSTAMACAPLAIIDQATGETYPQSSPRGLAHDQADYRARSTSVFLAQVSVVSMTDQNQLAFTLTPVTALYGTPLPAVAVIELRHLSQTCARVRLEPGALVVAYAAERGGRYDVVGFASIADLQDRPPGFPTERMLERGQYTLPTYGGATDQYSAAYQRTFDLGAPPDSGAMMIMYDETQRLSVITRRDALSVGSGGWFIFEFCNAGAYCVRIDETPGPLIILEPTAQTTEFYGWRYQVTRDVMTHESCDGYRANRDSDDLSFAYTHCGSLGITDIKTFEGDQMLRRYELRSYTGLGGD